MKNKLMALFLAIALALALFPAIARPAFAKTGSCGENVTYTLENGLLTISGTGPMMDYDYNTEPWWYFNPGSGLKPEPSRIVQKIVIEDGVTSIGAHAFCNTAVESVSIPDSVTSIGEYAFYGCTELRSVDLPEQLTVLPLYGFAECNSLQRIYIPAAVTEIAPSCFGYCPMLQAIEVAADNPVYDSRNECNAIITTETNDLLLGCASTVIPDTVTSIGHAAFAGSGIRSLYIPASVTFILNDVFFLCHDLEELEVDPANPVYDSRNGCNAIVETDGNRLIYGANQTVIPDGIQIIEDRAFYGRAGLTSLDVPDSVTQLEGEAFMCCTSLKELHLPDALESLGVCICSGCTSLEEVTLPSTLIEIPTETFYQCISLRKADIPESVTNIGVRAFEGCHSLEQIHIPAAVQRIGTEAFFDCRNVQSITVEEGNTAFDSRENCNALISTRTDTLLYGCSNTVAVPDGVQSIDKYAFVNCYGLKSITIPTSVTKIYNAFFSSGDYDGSEPEQLTVYYKGSYAQWKKINIDNYNWWIEEGLIYYTEGDLRYSVRQEDGEYYTRNILRIEGNGAIPDYEKDVPWKDIRATELEFAEGITAIGTNALPFTNLDRISLPSTLTTVSDHVFWDLSLLKKNGKILFTGAPEQWKEMSVGIENDLLFSESFQIAGHTHDFGEWVTITASTCEDAGVKQHTCNTCGFIETADLDPSEHSWEDDFTIDVPATCTAAGSKSIHCRNCDVVKDRTVIDAIGHDWVEGRVTAEAATCTSTGNTAYYFCSACGKYFADKEGLDEIEENSWVIPALGHDYLEVPNSAKAATCTEAGRKADQQCSRCGDLIKGAAVKPAGHKWSSWKTVTAATVMKKGKQQRTCSVCGKVQSKTPAKLKPTVKLSATKKTIKAKKSFTLTISRLAKGDSVKSVKSGKTKVATVKKTKTNKYKITGKKKGKAVFTVTLKSGKKVKCTVTVK